jgi:hypothetical protein
MPKRLNGDEVKQLFTQAGFIPDNDFRYTNAKRKYRVFDILNNKYVNITVQTLRYNIKTGKRPLWEEPQMLANEDPEYRDGIERFNQRIPELPAEIQQQTFNEHQQIIRRIVRKQNFTYLFDQIDPETKHNQMRGLIMALQNALPRVFPTHNIRLKLTTTSGLERYFHINPTSLDDLWEIFSPADPDFSVEDSSGNFALNDDDYAQIDFVFKEPKHGRQVAAGFYPFVNVSDVDLSRYGIYREDEIERAIEPCLITAFRSSNILNKDEMNQLTEMINTREFPQIYLRNIAEHFKINIYVRKYHSDGKSSHVEFNPVGAYRNIKLMIVNNHYMLYEQLAKNKYSYALVKQASVKPFTKKHYERVFKKMISSENVSSAPNYNAARLIKRLPPTPKPMSPDYRKQIKHGAHLFGYQPEDCEIEQRLEELQDFVDTIPTKTRINVRKYFKFSHLMQRIMYEYGCFDDVYEIAGELRDNIRNELVFPKRDLIVSEINEKCYYLDFNGAYSSFMTHIPTGPSANGPANRKISELIRLMYNKRIEMRSINPKLSKTIKFIMNSCYGTSIQKPKIIKHKYSTNISGTIDNQGDFVISTEAGNEGFVNIIQPYVEHYSHPHFAKVILDGFQQKVQEIKSIVNVLFQNIDAFIVNESDYNKLVELGYIHPTELGKLKVEHVFKSVRFYSKMKWIGINEDNSEFRHCV